ncbi:MAG: ATP-dependent helicase [Tissierella sp.]|uniref:ATP-dependent helicase n=1 Tax=Tissierella sp. TaxID=41274 RepID=UPI003F9744E1
MILSKEQSNAVNHIKKPALVLAVPGAGKTTVLIHRTYNLIEHLNINPLKILSITFSKASALDMKNRFINSFPQVNSKNIHFSTIHAFCYRLISEYSYRNRKKYKLIEGNKGENKFILLKNLYLHVNKTYITEEKLESLLNSIGYIKNMMLDVDEFLKLYKIDISNFKTIYDKYETYKRENDLLDFDDMLSISWEILNKDEYLLSKYREKYQYIQVDEGQDTSRLQLEIIKLIAYPKNNLFIVADDDQSIYGFRGAYPKGLLNFKSQFKDGSIYFMEENYRSSSNIVNTCNDFIKTNTLRYKKDIFTENSNMEPINIVKVKFLNDQYNYLIKDMEDKDFNNTSILYRNNLSSIGLIEVLSQNNIPFSTQDKNLKFFNHWVIKDIIDFINFSKNPERIDLFEKFYYKMKGYISKKQLNYAKTLNENLNVFDRIMDFPGIKQYHRRNVRNLKLDFKKLSKLNVKDAIDYIESNLEYGSYLKDNSVKFGYVYDNLSTLLFYLKMISSSCESLDELLIKLDSLKKLCANSHNNKEGIRLSTIHGAKGLEFENVYIVDLIDGNFPSANSIDDFENGDIDDLEEERRLFYVGMTRAKKHLTLLSSKYINGSLKETSRFITELENL